MLSFTFAPFIEISSPIPETRQLENYPSVRVSLHNSNYNILVGFRVIVMEEHVSMVNR